MARWRKTVAAIALAGIGCGILAINWLTSDFLGDVPTIVAAEPLRRPAQAQPASEPLAGPPPESLQSPGTVRPANDPLDPVPNLRRTLPVSGNPVRSVIEQQLPNGSREEHDIWFEQLKDLPPGVVEDLLRVRKHFGDAVPPFGASPLSPAMTLPSPLSASPGGMREPTAPARWSMSWDVWNRLEQIHLQNLANCDTPGYRTLVARTVNAGTMSWEGPGVPTRLGVAWGDVRISLSPGTLEPTLRSLDVAISGSGFLRVRLPEGPFAYSRDGRLTLDEDRRLAIPTAAGLVPLEPAIAIPEEATQVVITETGAVVVRLKGSQDDLSVGEIRLSDWLDAAALRYGVHGLLEENPQTGVRRDGAPGSESFGVLRTGMLEQSNVNRTEELRRLSELREFRSTILSSAPASLPPSPSHAPQ